MEGRAGNGVRGSFLYAGFLITLIISKEVKSGIFQSFSAMI